MTAFKAKDAFNTSRSEFLKAIEECSPNNIEAVSKSTVATARLKFSSDLIVKLNKLLGENKDWNKEWCEEGQ
ncbi:hypothetical protein [Methylomonas sp. HYX-M1]|uniref:hypothetical protein n=1 Tax=Methylomonas sp. HYX-M1 TaxID=3139307 RepID=UPI00345B4CD3